MEVNASDGSGGAPLPATSTAPDTQGVTYASVEFSAPTAAPAPQAASTKSNGGKKKIKKGEGNKGATARSNGTAAVSVGAGAGANAGAVGTARTHCARPSPTGGTCKTAALPGRNLCQKHACPECSASKSSSASGCPAHDYNGFDASGGNGGGGGSSRPNFFEGFDSDNGVEL
jgi:hypothetical protein